MAPVDTRRINGPSESQPIILFEKHSTTEAELLDDRSRRSDGRQRDEIRPIFMQKGVIAQARGSCYVETTGTKLVCGVYGPRDGARRTDYSTSGRLACEISYAPFSRRDERRVGQQYRAEDRELESHLIQALEPAICLDSFPKMQLDIYISVLEDSGGDALAHAIVAASVAVADAGIQMTDLVTAVALACTPRGPLVDPCGEEREHSSVTGSMRLAYLPSTNQLSALLSDGIMAVDECKANINAGIEACLRIHSVMRQCLLQT